MILIFLNYLSKSKEIEFNAIRFLRDFPKFVNPLSLKYVFLSNYWVSVFD